MKSNKVLILCVSFFFVFLAVGLAWLLSGNSGKATAAEDGDVAERTTGPMEWTNTGPMNLGKYIGQVAYNEGEDSYSLQLRGARFPFKASPILAQQVELEAKGENALEKNTALLHGVLGPEVDHVTLLIDPDEEDEVMPGVIDIARYMRMVNPAKFAGFAYTKPGGKMEESVVKGSEIQALKDATSQTPIVQIMGPKSGATDTKVAVVGDGMIVGRRQLCQFRLNYLPTR